MSYMKFTLFTPHQSFPSVECDTVRLDIADSSDGSFSGSYGIKKGHAKAVFALKSGNVSASLNGQKIFDAECGGGFATVGNDEVRVVVDSVNEQTV